MRSHKETASSPANRLVGQNAQTSHLNANIVPVIQRTNRLSVGVQPLRHTETTGTVSYARLQHSADRRRIPARTQESINLTMASRAASSLHGFPLITAPDDVQDRIEKQRERQRAHRLLALTPNAFARHSEVSGRPLPAAQPNARPKDSGAMRGRFRMC